MKHRYETHLHTSPVSACARASVEDSVRAYKALGYTGVFITNHFLDGNIAFEIRGHSYAEMLDYYYRDYLDAKRVGDEIGIDVFFGVELSYKGTDFLIYGLDIDWYHAHPEIMEMSKKEELRFMAQEGALVIQAHPFREARYIDHIRLFPREVHGTEIVNASRTSDENAMAKLYCEHYGLIPFAGTDNHAGADRTTFAGMECDVRIEDEREFVRRVLTGDMQVFTLNTEE